MYTLFNSHINVEIAAQRREAQTTAGRNSRLLRWLHSPSGSPADDGATVIPFKSTSTGPASEREHASVRVA